MSDLPTPDQIDGAPHPRTTPRVFGHDAAWADVTESFAAGRFHQGWLIAGPQGVGKATFAYQLAGYLLTRPAQDGPSLFGDDLAMDELPSQDHPVLTRMRAGSEPGLFVLKRPNDEKTGKLKSVIPVDEVRRLNSFFGMSTDGNGRRVVIVDAADEMNPSAANALLKLLEEPPALATLILIAHQPSALLPTIRSRCRMLNLKPLGADDTQAAMTQAVPDFDSDATVIELGAGSVGATLALGLHGGADVYARIVDTMATLPNMDRGKALGLSALSGPDQIDQTIDLLELFLVRLARSVFQRGGATQQAALGEAEVFARLCPTPYAARAWATMQQQTFQALRHGRAVNLDPSTLILDTLFKIEATAASLQDRTVT